MAGLLTTSVSSGDSERRASKDISHLNVNMDSFSPFPSPSSSFVPPPVPEAHEYATKLSTPPSRKNSSSMQEKTSTTQQKHRSFSSDITSSGGSSYSKVHSQGGEHHGVSSPPSSYKRSSSPPQAKSQRYDSDADDTAREAATLRSKHTSVSSLSSTRPAPQSPSLSRRTSTAASNCSRRSGSRHRSSMLMTPTQASSPNQPQKRRSIVVKIRDFAFKSDDIRHIGDGPDAPQNRARRGSGIELDPGSRRLSGWGAFKWALTSAPGRLFGFGGFGGRNSTDASGYPSNSDFSRNFDNSDAYEDEDDGDDDDEGVTYKEAGDEDEDDEDGYPDQDKPLLPGLYRAAYSFEPEGSAEMALEEGQIIRVIGRGGGVGWAIAVRGDSDSGAASHALVPESYLEVVQLD